MRKNREKFAAVVARLRNMKGNHAREVEAAQKGSTAVADRRILRLASVVALEGQWLCRVAEKKVVSNKHELTKDERANLDRASKYFDALVRDNRDVVDEGGFLPNVDAVYIVHLENVATLVMRLDAEQQARKAKALSLENFGSEDDDEELVEASPQ